MSARPRHTALAVLLCALAGGAHGAPPAVESEPTLKSLESRSIDTSRQPITEGLRDKSMEGYELFLKTPLGGAMRREALRRLADQIIERIEDIETAQVEAQAAGAAPRPEGELEVPPNATYADAIKYYVEALEKYPQFPGNEHILYQLARAYEANGEPENALKSLERLAKEHPFSPYAEEVLFRRAELAFLIKDFAKAEKGYKEILSQGEKGPFYDIALYKYGWAQFKQQQHEKSLDSFFALLDKTISGMRLEDFLDGMPSLSGGNRELVKDTLRVISLAFSHLEGPKSIYQYFSRAGQTRDYEFMVYETLANLFFDQERIGDAADTYKAFIKNNPNHPQAPFFQLMVMEAYTQGNFPSLALEAKKEFVATYGFLQPFWEGQSEALRAQVGPYLRLHVGDLARHYHANAQQSKQPEDYQEAVQWYQAFLGSFPKDPEAANIQFLLGELLFETKRFEQAAEAYEQAAYNYGEHPDANEAGYAALLAYEEHKKLLSGESRDAWERKAVASTLRFAKTYRKDSRVPPALTKAAQAQFLLNELEAASKTAYEVINYRPTPDEGLLLSAWLIVAHTQFETREFSKAESSYKSALKLVRKDDARHGEVTERLAASIYKQGEALRDEDKLRGAVRQFQRIAEEVPDSSIRYTAEYDASALLIQLKDWPAAIALLESLRASPKGKELDSAITQKLVIAYQETGDHRKAAKELEHLIQFEGDYNVKRDAVLLAAELYEKVGDINAAIHTYIGYTRDFPEPVEQKVEAQYKLAKLYKEQGGQAQYQHWLGQIIDTDKQAGAQGTPRTRLLAATAAFELIGPQFTEYQAVKLVEPVKENLKKKKDLMQAVVKAYNDAAAYGITDITTASTHMVAEIYADFGKALLNSERPKGMSKDEVEMYNVMLEEQAYPFEEKAIDIFETNARRTRQNVYNDWVKKSFAALSKLVPGRYDKSEKNELYIDALN